MAIRRAFPQELFDAIMSSKWECISPLECFLHSTGLLRKEIHPGASTIWNTDASLGHRRTMGVTYVMLNGYELILSLACENDRFSPIIDQLLLSNTKVLIRNCLSEETTMLVKTRREAIMTELTLCRATYMIPNLWDIVQTYMTSGLLDVKTSKKRKTRCLWFFKTNKMKHVFFNTTKPHCLDSYENNNI